MHAGVLWSVVLVCGRPSRVHRGSDVNTRAGPQPPSAPAPAVQDLLRRLLQKRPKQRLGFDAFFSHPFLSGQPLGVPTPLAADPPVVVEEPRSQFGTIEDDYVILSIPTGAQRPAEGEPGPGPGAEEGWASCSDAQAGPEARTLPGARETDAEQVLSMPLISLHGGGLGCIGIIAALLGHGSGVCICEDAVCGGRRDSCFARGASLHALPPRRVHCYRQQAARYETHA